MSYDQRLADSEHDLARLRAEDKALAELLKQANGLLIEALPYLKKADFAMLLVRDVEAHLAQHDSPGAGKEGAGHE